MIYLPYAFMSDKQLWVSRNSTWGECHGLCIGTWINVPFPIKLYWFSYFTSWFLPFLYTVVPSQASTVSFFTNLIHSYKIPPISYPTLPYALYLAFLLV